MMLLSKYQTANGPRWTLDGNFLPADFTLSLALEVPRASLGAFLESLPRSEPAQGVLLPPIEASQEIWASGVTYLRSRDARMSESDVADVYDRVYDAERPELFQKAVGWRAVTHAQPVRIRADSGWNVPEPEITLVINRDLDIVGYTAGNDMSSRDIEGANPLYLPQAKIYNGACSLGPEIVIAGPDDLRELAVRIDILRGGETVFRGDTSANQMKRSFEELVSYLGRELDFPQGVFLMTGTGVVPGDDFTLQSGDEVRIEVGTVFLSNVVA